MALPDVGMRDEGCHQVANRRNDQKVPVKSQLAQPHAAQLPERNAAFIEVQQY